MEVKVIKVSAKHIKLEIDGVIDSVGNWSKKLGINEVTLRSRLKKGVSLLHGEAWSQKDLPITIGKRTMTLAEWGEKEGISLTTMRARYIAGKRGEDLITKKFLKGV